MPHPITFVTVIPVTPRSFMAFLSASYRDILAIMTTLEIPVSVNGFTTGTAASFAASLASSYSSEPRLVFSFTSIVMVFDTSMMENPE